LGWSYCFAETHSGKIVKLEMVSWGTGDVANGRKPSFGGATLTITDAEGNVVLREKFKDGDYEFSGLPNNRAQVSFSASTERVDVKLSFKGSDQETDGDDKLLIKVLRDKKRVKEPGNSLVITDKEGGKTYSFTDVVSHLVKDA